MIINECLLRDNIANKSGDSGCDAPYSVREGQISALSGSKPGEVDVKAISNAPKDADPSGALKNSAAELRKIDTPPQIGKQSYPKIFGESGWGFEFPEPDPGQQDLRIDPK